MLRHEWSWLKRVSSLTGSRLKGGQGVDWVWCGFAVSSEVDLKNLLEDGIWDFQCLVLHQNYVIRVQIFVKSLFHLVIEEANL